MQKNKGVNNAQSLFGIQKIPSDNHIRDMLDVVPPETVFPVFTFIFEALVTEEYDNLVIGYLRKNRPDALYISFSKCIVLKVS